MVQSEHRSGDERWNRRTGLVGPLRNDVASRTGSTPAPAVSDPVHASRDADPERAAYPRQMPQNVDALLNLQLAMNPHTWSALLDLGVDETTLLVLEFAFDSPDQREAAALVDFLEKSTDYDVRVEAVDETTSSRQEWMVKGETKPTTLSLDVLNQWVRWMVAAGAANSCDFDGWGAHVP